MKVRMLILMLTCPLAGFSQTDWSGISTTNYMEIKNPELELATRTYEPKDHFYIIEFRYDPHVFTRPATSPAGDPHYHAKIKVFEVKEGKRLQIGPEFDGQYIERGCFEDKSEDLVARVMKLTLPANNPAARTP